MLDAAGVATVAIAANVAGTAANLPAGSQATLMAAPAGVSSQVLLASMSGGVEAESDAELLARLLELIRRPPAGGNRYDYRRWALEVPGVSAAYVYPLRRGLGTVDVVVTSAGGLPSSSHRGGGTGVYRRRAAGDGQERPGTGTHRKTGQRQRAGAVGRYHAGGG